jgi:L-ascorbate metabolism protein UlaG (beta-lactamase superfamily)
MRTKKAIAIIDRDHVLIRSGPLPRRMAFSEATGEPAMTSARITLIGGPTALIELDGFRLLTDPTFDPPGEHQLPHVRLTKTAHPALSSEQVGSIDAVLLSHDQHADNLDHSGRAFLARAERVFTTEAGARRLGGHAEGLAAWTTKELTKPDGHRLQVTATPARHGPVGIEPLSGDVIGFVVASEDQQVPPIYITGDTVWYEGVAEVARRFKIGLVIHSLARRARAGRSISRWTPMM